MIPDFAAGRLLVAGDVMLDRYWSGPTSRISPEAPVPVVRITGEDARAGGAANVALNIAALGARVRLLGVVGRDESAERLRAAVAAAHVEPDFEVTPDRPTVTKLRVLSRNQQLIRLDFEEPATHVGAFDFNVWRARFRSALANAQTVVLSDYGKGTLADPAALIADARAAACPLLVDPKGTDWRAYTGATLITPNLAELEAVVGPCQDDAAVVAKGTRLMRDLSLEALLVTRSERGMTLLVPGQPPLHLPTQAREVYDVTGAGDTVIGVLAAGLATGLDFAQAAHYANLAAGVVVGKLGTATASPAELSRAVRRQHEDDTGVLGEEELLERVAEARRNGQVIVMTNGCFDLLHVGHVRYLEAARKRGDVLIVAVNTDASVKRLKGDARPINIERDRMRVLAALKSVDWVVPFAEDTPARLIERVLPDVLVKGGDYTPEQVVGHDIVQAHGGRVEVLDFYPGYSTTGTIEKTRGG
ncbi:MAG: bifunctional D-glycero-beta-D-manno-heptose-7-phosphate kinase/D-glycero-beta-D-manno-heptose 1-phosphate adenylyltransferase HldE [Nevskiaceae bacterium]|nr:MAG: bifunctional D-glycero-beta-D-manno-heptose-7-phosphate kinase/D-glycero-beta-D-manno-heptose 1-phosphate adenylyltransferase HldE [Nevskiaceae bacterium]TBR71402.1 MAG: bifunctional D-glycero-beta-D-manno-heptose-7-phosphate kinase/D-glycero-beta-D-manno-heptose 1-phosphate adenylyltransferase HldE [Nevskiaceae bacterium]